jgi:hypothetical protein
MVLTTIINADNHNDFRIVPEKNGMVRQFILTRYGRSYNMHDNGKTHYLLLCESMCYPFGVEPGHYKADIKGDSIHIQHIAEEEFNRCNPKKKEEEEE